MTRWRPFGSDADTAHPSVFPMTLPWEGLKFIRCGRTFGAGDGVHCPQLLHRVLEAKSTGHTTLMRRYVESTALTELIDINPTNY